MDQNTSETSAARTTKDTKHTATKRRKSTAKPPPTGVTVTCYDSTGKPVPRIIVDPQRVDSHIHLASSAKEDRPRIRSLGSSSSKHFSCQCTHKVRANQSCRMGKSNGARRSELQRYSRGNTELLCHLFVFCCINETISLLWRPSSELWWRKTASCANKA